MKKGFKGVFLVVMFLFTTLLLIGCKSNALLDEALAEMDTTLANITLQDGDVFSISDKYQDISISWTSGNTDIISNDGVVDASSIDVVTEVTITVQFTGDGIEFSRDYTVSVSPIVENTDLTKLNTVKTGLTLPATTTVDLTLLTEINGVTISWSSDNAAITNEGVVTRSATDDVTVTLTATLTIGEESDTKTFSIVVEKQSILTDAKASLVIDSSVSTDMTLPATIGETNVVNITWASDNAAISNTGVVTQSLTEDVTVTLTATLTFNGETDTKEFTVIVLQDETLVDAVAQLTLDASVSTDITLPTTSGDVAISWASNNAAISDTGEVTQSLTEDVTVELTATLTYKGVSQDKVFTVVVSQDATLEDAVDGLTLVTEVEEDITLPTTIGDVTVSWESNHKAISNTGEVTRSLEGDITVELTATLSYLGVTEEKVFTVTVKQYVLPTLAAPVGFVWQSGPEFFAYAAYAAEGYSGNMRITVTLNGEEVLVEVNASQGGQYFISEAGKATLSSGVEYMATFEAIGDGLNYSDSAASGAVAFTLPQQALGTPANLVITEGVLTWDAVTNAESYNVYAKLGEAEETLLTNVLSSETLSATLPTEEGVYTIRVEAVATGYDASSETITYNLAGTLTALPAPVGFVWQAGPEFFAYAAYAAEGYSGNMRITVTLNGEEVLVEVNASQGGQYFISEAGKATLSSGVEYMATFEAIGDGLNYSDSAASGAVAFTLPQQALGTPANLVITEGVLTWDAVTNAESYNVYAKLGEAEETLLTNVLSSETLSATLPTEEGVYTIRVEAVATGYDASSETITYNLAGTLTALPAPVGFVWQAGPEFFAYAAYAAEGYSGNMRITVTLNGEEVLVEVNASQGGQYFISEAGKATLSSGVEYMATFEAIGDGVNYSDSAASGAVAFTLPQQALGTPANLVITEGVLTWDAVTNAESYNVYAKLGEAEETLLTNVLSSETLSATLPTEEGVYTIRVEAVATGYDASSETIGYNLSGSLSKVDASGLLIQANVANNGHYAIERPATFNPNGWATGQYIVEIYQGETLVRSGNYTNEGSVIFFQTPGDANGLLYGLTPGEYTAHFIMVGNQTTHENSDPKVFVFNFAG